MFDLDFGKLIIVGVMALVFIGPKELPGVLRQIGQAYGKMQRMAAEFKGQFMDAINEADVEGLRKDLAEVTDAARLDFDVKAKKFDHDEFAENITSIAPPAETNTEMPKRKSRAAVSKPRAAELKPRAAVRKPRAAEDTSVSAVDLGTVNPKLRKQRAPAKTSPIKNVDLENVSVSDHDG